MFHVARIKLKPRCVRPTSFSFLSFLYWFLPGQDRRKEKKKDCGVSCPKGITMSVVLEEVSRHSRSVQVLLSNPALAASKLPGISHYLQHRKPDGNDASWNQQKVLCCVVQGKENNQSKGCDWWINLKIEGHAISSLRNALIKKRSYKNSSN